MIIQREEETAIAALVRSGEQFNALDYGQMTARELAALLRQNYREAFQAKVITFLIQAVRKLGTKQSDALINYASDEGMSIRATFDASSFRLEIIADGHLVCDNKPGEERFVKQDRWLYTIADAYRAVIAKEEAEVMRQELLAQDRLLIDLNANL